MKPKYVWVVEVESHRIWMNVAAFSNFYRALKFMRSAEFRAEYQDEEHFRIETVYLNSYCGDNRIRWYTYDSLGNFIGRDSIYMRDFQELEPNYRGF